MITFILCAHLASAGAPDRKELNERIKRTEQTEAKDMSKPVDYPQKDPVEALAEPSATSREIPIDRKLVLPFERRPATPADAEARLRIANSIWKTSLGQTLLGYLFDRVDPVELPARARQFIRWILADGAQVPTRLAALQLLTGDLYVRGRMTDDAVRRLMLLHNDLFQESQNGSMHMKKRLVFLLVVFIVLSLPFGSPIVRQELGKIWARPVAFFRRVLRHAKNQKLERITPLRMFSRDVFKGYEMTPAVNAFFASFGPASMLYFLYVEWALGVTGQLLQDTKMLDGLDSLMRATEF